MLVVHGVIGFESEVMLATVAEFHTRLLLHGSSKFSGQGKQHVASTLPVSSIASTIASRMGGVAPQIRWASRCDSRRLGAVSPLQS
jgi:hypothetical protein